MTKKKEIGDAEKLEVIQDDCGNNIVLIPDIIFPINKILTGVK